MSVPILGIVNNSKHITPEVFFPFIGALQQQVTLHVSPVWKKDFAIISLKNLTNAPMLYLTDDEPKENTLGWRTSNVGYVYIKRILEKQACWTEIASHECLEMMVDGGLKTYVNRNDKEFWAHQICDPVLGTHYFINKIQLSNFVYPNYFVDNSHGPYDYLNVLKEPFSLCPTGYHTVVTVEKGIRKDKYYDVK